MKTYIFELVLDENLSDNQVNLLYKAGLDDGSFEDCDGVTTIHLERQANSYDDAIKIALKQVEDSIPVLVKDIVFHTQELAYA